MRRLLAWGVPGSRVVVGGVKEVKKAFQATRNVQKRHQNSRYPILFAKNAFFALKYFTKYALQVFFKEYIKFEIFSYLRRCGVIPVQSFGSPQPPGLGLRIKEFAGLIPKVLRD